MRIPVLVGMTLVALWPGFARAVDKADFDLKTTEDLYKVCSVGPDDPLRAQALNFCEGFLLGVVSYHDQVTERRKLKRLICYPPTVTRDQGIQAFNNWAASHQQDQKYMNEPPVIGAVRGLASTWPCK
ncbi:MAG TPA: Rap1a/Tai family immunity protein [Stellaceae bacterium]|nr:Rap1a/Tai family immunity protein [Stellaceae bacterium]